MTKGFFLSAFGSQEYYRMTINLAISIRYQGDNNPISLLTDNPENPLIKDFSFDQIIDANDFYDQYDKKFKFKTIHEKCGIFPRLLFSFSPYDKSIYIDSDCVVINSTNKLWEISRKYNYTMTGCDKLLPGWGKMTSNEIRWVEKELGCNLKECHAGVTWFDKSDISKKVSQDIEHCLQENIFDKYFKKLRKTKSGGRNNESCIVYAMSKNNLPVIPYNHNIISPEPKNFDASKGVADMGHFANKKTHLYNYYKFNSKNPIIAHIFSKTKHKDYAKNEQMLKKFLHFNNAARPMMPQKDIDVIYSLIQTYKPKNVLEWGCGNSSLYFSSCPCISSWTSIENNQSWYKKINSVCSKKVNIKYIDTSQNYHNYINFESNKKFNLILIDGRERSQCIYRSKNIINEDGVVVLHDASRSRYHKAISSYPYHAFLTTGQASKKPNTFDKEKSNDGQYWHQGIAAMSFKPLDKLVKK